MSKEQMYQLEAYIDGWEKHNQVSNVKISKKQGFEAVLEIMKGKQK